MLGFPQNHCLRQTSPCFWRLSAVIGLCHSRSPLFSPLALGTPIPWQYLFLSTLAFREYPWASQKCHCLNARKFRIALVKRLFYSPSEEYGLVVGSLVSQNKPILTFHLPKSSAPFITIMTRYSCITISFTAGHYCVKASKSHPRVYQSKIQVSLTILWIPNHWCVPVGQWFPGPIPSFSLPH